jgi:Ca-activated chloride channel family protein
VESFKPERYGDATRQAALGFVEGIYAGGSTNIDGALRTALKQLTDSSRPSYVLFLTDGLPTAGEVNETKIVANAKAENPNRARIVAFGVGYDLNSRLLDKLVRENYGQSEYVRPDEDIEARVSKLFQRIEAPVLTDVSLKFDVEGLRAEDGSATNRIYPKGTFDLFEGEQLVVVGRYKKPGSAKVVVSGAVGGQSQSFDFPATFVEKSADDTNGFVEKLWATRRVGEIIDELDLKGRNEELIKELVELSTKHGIMTPYTSFLADETTRLSDLAANTAEAEVRLKRLAEVDGLSGVAQRGGKAELQFGVRALAPSSAPAKAAGNAVYRDADTDKEVVVESIRNVGNKSFYCRNHQWIDSTVTEEQQKNARKVTQFSDEFFKLADRHGKKLSQCLVFDEPVFVNLDGDVVMIEVGN